MSATAPNVSAMTKPTAPQAQALDLTRIITVEIRAGDDIDEFESKGKKYRKQVAYMQFPGQPYPTRCKVWANKAVIAPGLYGVDLTKSFRTGDNDQAMFDPRLVSLS